MAAHTALGEWQQRFGDQLRTEERATNADIHHVGDGLFSVTAPQAIVDAADHLGHLVQHSLHLRHHIDAIDQYLVADGAAQGGMQRRTGFRCIDRFTIEQGADRLGQTGFLRQVDQ